MDFDLGNLTAYDPSPINAEEFLANPDTACLDAATKVTQALIAQLFALPSEAADVGRVARLPAPTTALPRAKALPKPREPTKWEKFAAQKGINQKRKRSREVWDADTKEYKRRHGYGSIKDDAPAVIEARASDKVISSNKDGLNTSWGAVTTVLVLPVLYTATLPSVRCQQHSHSHRSHHNLSSLSHLQLVVALPLCKLQMTYWTVPAHTHKLHASCHRQGEVCVTSSLKREREPCHGYQT